MMKGYDPERCRKALSSRGDPLRRRLALAVTIHKIRLAAHRAFAGRGRTVGAGADIRSADAKVSTMRAGLKMCTVGSGR
jgi:hypothetical protein